MLMLGPLLAMNLSTQTFGRPIAEHTYFTGIETALANGEPDLQARSNHWSLVTEKYFVIADSRTPARHESEKTSLSHTTLQFTTGGEDFRQDGKAPKLPLPEFRYINVPTPKQTTVFDLPACDVSPHRDIVEYLGQTTIDETEVRLVRGRRITRSRTTLSYSVQTIGLAEGESYDPFTQKRSGI